jgi:hypothetical protein
MAPLRIHPVVAGKGKRLFRDGGDLKQLKLVDAKTTSTGWRTTQSLIIVTTFRNAYGGISRWIDAASTGLAKPCSRLSDVLSEGQRLSSRLDSDQRWGLHGG